MPHITPLDLSTESNNPKNTDDNNTNNINIKKEHESSLLDDIPSLPSITLTNDEYFKWVKNSSSSSSSNNKSQQLLTNNYDINKLRQDLISRSDTMTTVNTLSSTPVLIDHFDKNNTKTNNGINNQQKLTTSSSSISSLARNDNNYHHHHQYQNFNNHQVPKTRISISLLNDDNNIKIENHHPNQFLM